MAQKSAYGGTAERPERGPSKPSAAQGQDVVARLLGQPFADLDLRAQKVAEHVAERRHIARNLSQPAADDAVASFGGSWTFVGLFAATMLG